MSAKKQGIKFSQYKSRAKKNNLKFNLSKKEFIFILEKDCYYCKTPNANGIDRYSNNKGYYHGNIVPCCWTCNRAKSDMSFMDFEDYIQKFTKIDVSVENQKKKLSEEPSSLKRASMIFEQYSGLL